jgi:mannose-1-phosphate guanylyltransferase
MAGGRGTRFWPASRESRPKQFLAVGGEDSLLRLTGKRLLPLSGPDRTWIVTNAAHVALAAEHLPEVPRERIVGEPVGRNTAPCIALAAALVLREDPDGVLLVAPADHWIGDEEEFRRAAEVAARTADEERALVTFGIRPTSPDTGYGYIEAGKAVSSEVFRVAHFREKPDRATAEKFLTSGRHWWNGGIFAWRADVFLDELAKHHPDMAAGCRAIASAADRDLGLAAVYPGLASISVDYAVLERARGVFMVAAKFPWSDVGSWNALADVLPANGDGNVTEGDALTLDSSGCLVRSRSRFTAVVGVKDLLIVDMPDALLVCPKDRAQDVKRIVEKLEGEGRKELL